MQSTPTNASDDGSRTFFFMLTLDSDKFTPADISVSGVKPTVFVDGAALSGTAADIVKVSATFGLYSWTATTSQVNQAAGKVVFGSIKPATCAQSNFTGQLGPAAMLSEPLSSSTIATAVVAALMAYVVEPSLTFLGWLRVVGAKIAGITTGGGGVSEVFKGLRNDGTPGKTRVTETNDGTNRTARTFDVTDE